MIGIQRLIIELMGILWSRCLIKWALIKLQLIRFGDWFLIIGILFSSMSMLIVSFILQGKLSKVFLYPLSFFLSTELMSRTLNNLFYNKYFRDFDCLSVVIIWTILHMLMVQIFLYLLIKSPFRWSWIHQGICFLFVYHKTTKTIIQEVEYCTNFSKGRFPLTYLG